ncbi:hypothetical protein [Leptospira kirschneri]|uniref:hypothetical protein n=1 Tax=Leptospira kirschneri TaxID=29507 RepID=UPI0011462734|nr:hypothetical protein [Leptospira kirschneri]
MGSLYKEQQKTNKLLQAQVNAQRESIRSQDDELRKQTAILEQEHRNKEYQKYLKTFIFEIKKYSDSISSKKYSSVSAYIVAKTLIGRFSDENISVYSFDELQG